MKFNRALRLLQSSSASIMAVRLSHCPPFSRSGPLIDKVDALQFNHLHPAYHYIRQILADKHLCYTDLTGLQSFEFPKFQNSKKAKKNTTEKRHIDSSSEIHQTNKSLFSWRTKLCKKLSRKLNEKNTPKKACGYLDMGIIAIFQLLSMIAHFTTKIILLRNMN